MIKLREIAQKVVKSSKKAYGLELARQSLEEMPHVTYGPATLDLSIEKYSISPQEKKTLFKKFSETGVYAYSFKHNKWLFITKHNIKVVEQPTDRDSILPDEWEKYIVWDI